jgi:DedD protein
MMNQQLKQRLVGAVVLVSLAVIFIPIILEGPDDEWTPRTQGMPEPPPISYHEEAETQLPLPVEQLAPPAAIQPAEPVESVPPPAPDTAAAEAPAPQPAPPEPATVAPATVAPPPPPASVAKTGAEAAGGWAIQVGRFSQQQNAQGLRDRLKKAGYAAFLKEDRTDSSRSWRVLVGPLKTRSDAEKVRDELAARRQLKGFVIENNG